MFCGSKKSLAAGIPMAQHPLPRRRALGLVVLPLMLFHQAQLFACATLARRYGHRGNRAAARPAINSPALPQAPYPAG